MRIANAWDSFLKSGRINDYLLYKRENRYYDAYDDQYFDDYDYDYDEEGNAFADFDTGRSHRYDRY